MANFKAKIPKIKEYFGLFATHGKIRGKEIPYFFAYFCCPTSFWAYEKMRKTSIFFMRSVEANRYPLWSGVILVIIHRREAGVYKERPPRPFCPQQQSLLGGINREPKLIMRNQPIVFALIAIFYTSLLVQQVNQPVFGFFKQVLAFLGRFWQFYVSFGYFSDKYLSDVSFGYFYASFGQYSKLVLYFIQDLAILCNFWLF